MRKYFSMIERGKPSEAFAKTWRLRSKKKPDSLSTES